MQLPTSYVLDREAIKLNAYRLISYFYANKEIARSTDPDKRDSAIAKLEDKYFFREICRLLLEVTIALRVLDDQMRARDKSSEIKRSYDAAMEQVNKSYNCMMFDGMNLREVCNKIIHADVVEPHIQESENGDHEIDNLNWLGWSEVVEHSGDSSIPEPVPIKWSHLTNNIRLGGKYQGKQWWYLLDIPVFVEAIGELLD